MTRRRSSPRDQLPARGQSAPERRREWTNCRRGCNNVAAWDLTVTWWLVLTTVIERAGKCVVQEKKTYLPGLDSMFKT